MDFDQLILLVRVALTAMACGAFGFVAWLTPVLVRSGHFGLVTLNVVAQLFMWSGVLFMWSVP